MKNKKGFTLIELLAVIVILGLLMAIAIPSVTKYITESRKKTVVSTIGNYITAMVNEVNDLTYTFTGDNTVYAVPIECIALERGGTNPFGAWHQASNSYWAYVLVQYDDETSSYRYGYTFKDSAGYGLYPTSQAKLNEQGKQIQTGLSLTRPSNGKITNITSVDNWSGFTVDSTTDLVVLEAASEGDVGDGKTTCTLQQKGDNYLQVEEEKDDNLVIDTPIYFGKPYDLFFDGGMESYIFYEDGSAKYYFDCDLEATEPAGAFEYNGNQIVYVADDETWFTVSGDKKKLTSSWDEELYFTLNQSSNWCVDEYANLPMLRKTNEDIAFWQYRDKIKTITFQNSINIPNNISSEHKWDMTKSQNGKVMAYIKPNASNSSYYDLYIQGDGKVYANPNSSYLFYNFANVDVINNIEILDTSKVTNMSWMFHSFGISSSKLTLDLGNNFDTHNVTNMDSMFMNTGRASTVFTLNLGNKFDTSKVIHMSYMFFETGYSSSNFTLDLGKNFDTSKVTHMSGMFDGTGYSSKVFTLDLGSKFNTSNVIYMGGMFDNAGRSSEVFTLDLGDKFDTSNVVDMNAMFRCIGYSNASFTLDLGSKFDTSNVVDMTFMFVNAGYSNPSFKLDCSNWNVSKVTSHDKFNYGVTSKVIPPVWK